MPDQAPQPSDTQNDSLDEIVKTYVPEGYSQKDARIAIEQYGYEQRIDELRGMQRSADLYSDLSARVLVTRVWLPNRIESLERLKKGDVDV